MRPKITIHDPTSSRFPILSFLLNIKTPIYLKRPLTYLKRIRCTDFVSQAYHSCKLLSTGSNINFSTNYYSVLYFLHLHSFIESILHIFKDGLSFFPSSSFYDDAFDNLEQRQLQRNKVKFSLVPQIPSFIDISQYLDFFRDIKVKQI